MKMTTDSRRMMGMFEIKTYGEFNYHILSGKSSVTHWTLLSRHSNKLCGFEIDDTDDLVVISNTGEELDRYEYVLGNNGLNRFEDFVKEYILMVGDGNSRGF